MESAAPVIARSLIVLLVAVSLAVFGLGGASATALHGDAAAVTVQASAPAAANNHGCPTPGHDHPVEQEHHHCVPTIMGMASDSAAAIWRPMDQSPLTRSPDEQANAGPMFGVFRPPRAV